VRLAPLRYGCAYWAIAPASAVNPPAKPIVQTQLNANLLGAVSDFTHFKNKKMKQISSLRNKKLSGNQMKQLKGGAGVLPSKWWYCPTNLIECGAPQAQCNANCPGAVCKLTSVCL
jgi:hypothetical protein